MTATAVLLLTGCGPLGSSVGEPTRDYSVIAAPERAPDGEAHAAGASVELASGHLVAVDGVRSVDAPPPGQRWLRPPLGDVLVVDLGFAEGDSGGWLLVEPDVLLPTSDGRRLRADLCVRDDEAVAADPLTEGLTVCVDVPPALTADIDEVQLIDRTGGVGDSPAASSDREVLRWQVDVD